MNTIRLGFARAGYEIRGYFRQGDSLFFTFLFPVVMLLIFSTAFSNVTFGDPANGTAISAAAYYLPAMLAAGMLLSGLQALAISIAEEKSDGTLKRLAGTPLPVLSYFMGKFGQVLATSVLQAVLVIGASGLLFGVQLPSDPGRWGTLVWVFLLGVVTSATLGIVLSAIPRSGRSATAVIIPIVLVLQFISGIYLPFAQLPSWLQTFASVFPLKWLAQGAREVFLPDSYQVAEVGGTWNLGGVALVLGIWLVAGIVLARLTFRWIRKDS